MSDEISMHQYQQLKRRDPRAAIEAMIDGRVYDAPVALVEQHRLNHHARTNDRSLAKSVAAQQTEPKLRFRKGQ